MTSKYPPHRRASTSELNDRLPARKARGSLPDVVLIRTPGRDWVDSGLRDDAGRPRPVPPGKYLVAKITGPTRRYYLVSLVDENETIWTVKAPGHQKWNLVEG